MLYSEWILWICWINVPPQTYLYHSPIPKDWMISGCKACTFLGENSVTPLVDECRYWNL